jgi:hypothetical protein
MTHECAANKAAVTRDEDSPGVCHDVTLTASGSRLVTAEYLEAFASHMCVTLGELEIALDHFGHHALKTTLGLPPEDTTRLG